MSVPLLDSKYGGFFSQSRAVWRSIDLVNSLHTPMNGGCICFRAGNLDEFQIPAGDRLGYLSRKYPAINSTVAFPEFIFG